MPRKRTIDTVSLPLREPDLSPRQQRMLDHGLELYNAGHYWHAHEAWEQLWLEMPDDPSGDAEIVLRGMIQLAAALHQLQQGRPRQTIGNFEKARQKLRLAGDVFLGIDMRKLER